MKLNEHTALVYVSDLTIDKLEEELTRHLEDGEPQDIDIEITISREGIAYMAATVTFEETAETAEMREFHILRSRDHKDLHAVVEDMRRPPGELTTFMVNFSMGIDGTGREQHVALIYRAYLPADA